MIFLIDYDRRTGRLVKLTPFLDANREQAQDSRLRLELELNRAGIEREIVLLEGSDEDALRRTHRRYFEDHRRYFEDLSDLIEWPEGELPEYKPSDDESV